MIARSISSAILLVFIASFSTEASKQDYATPLLNQDLRWIVSNDELFAFKKLDNDNDRDIFFDQFWLRRDPTPDTYENEFKNEHYRRLRYALEHFSHCTPGYLTDRGRVYVLWGDPDKTSEAKDEGHPALIWSYNKLKGFPPEFEFKFVDACSCGDYRLKLDEDTDKVLQEAFAKNGLPKGPEFYVGPSRRRSRFRDLEAVLSSKVFIKDIPLSVGTEITPLTDANVWTTFKIDIPSDRLGKIAGDVGNAHVRAVVRLLTLTGRVAEFIELESQELLANSGNYTISKSIPLRAGRYRIDVVVHDLVADRIGTHSRGITVSTFEPVRERFRCAAQD